MRQIYHWLLVSGFGFLATQIVSAQAQTSPNCATLTDQVFYTGEILVNYGSTAGAFNALNRSTHTIGQPAIGTGLEQRYTGGFGFWSRFLLPPSAPAVYASEGDLPDRINISWAPDPLSPEASEGFNLYRNGALLASVDADVRAYVDFNVIAGTFYTYTVSGKNIFGEGRKGTALGFLNPNGVVTGQVKTFAGSPVQNATVTLTPTLGSALQFSGDGMAFIVGSDSFPQEKWTVSAWVKIGTGNDNTAILDFGSTENKNFWVHTLPAASGKGVRIGVGEGSTAQTLDYAFPAADADDWHQVAMTYNGGSVILYVDGEFVGTKVTGFQADSLTAFLGRKPDDTGFFIGKLDDVRIFDRQLSQSEIQMTKNRTVNSDAEGLVAYWKFDEAVGTKGFDVSKNKLKAYLCGPAWTGDRPLVQNAGITDEEGYYKIDAINYAAGTTFSAMPEKSFYYNQSLEFNASNGQYADLTNFDLHDTATVSFTFKPFDLSGTQTIFSKQGAGGSDQMLATLENGVLKIKIGADEKSYGAVSAGFHQVAMTILQNGSSVAAQVYMDGAAIGGPENFTGVDADFATGTVWTLGAKRSAGGTAEQFFTGLVDELAVYSKNLTLQEIQLAASVGTNPAHLKLKNYFNLNEGIADSLQDLGSDLTGMGVRHGATWSTSAMLEQTLPHEFTPSIRLVTLNPSNTSTDQVDFIDKSLVPVSGFVRYDGTVCFIENAEILGDGLRLSPPVFTDENGKFICELEPGSTVRLSAKYEDHTIMLPWWEVRNVAAPIAGIVFRDMVKREVSGQIAGGLCRKSVIPPGAVVKVKVASEDECFEKIITLTHDDNANGKFKFTNLPPKKMVISVIEHSNSVIYDYFQLQGGVSIDLTHDNDTIDFIYFSPPELELTALDTNSCGDPMLGQSSRYSVEVRVFQDYDGGKCYLQEADLSFFNEIADQSQFDTVMTEGKLKYSFYAGQPQLVAPHLKSLTVAATADGQTSSSTLEAVVTGIRARNVNFTSTSPDIPMLILRDPPGDASSSRIEKGEEMCFGMNFGISTETTVGEELTVIAGNTQEIAVGVGTEKTTEIEITDNITFGVEATVGATFGSNLDMCWSFNEVVQTSDDEVLVGEDADLYMGAAMNLLYGITDNLEYDADSCKYDLNRGLMVFPDKFATTFIYTQYHIENTVIPALEAVGDVLSANRWRLIIAKNRQLKENAAFDENISFNAGVIYDKSETNTISSGLEFGFEVSVTASIADELGFTIDDTGLSSTITASVTMGASAGLSTTSSESTTTGYTLADNDAGDYFSVDVLHDDTYGTPVFRTVSGASSCPYEENTVPRESVELTVDRQVAVNVPENGEAVFKFTLGNVSETEDTREYLFGLIPESNTSGAVVKINGGGALDRPFGLPFGAGQEVTVTVERGPVEFDYEDLEFAIYSECEDSRGVTLGLASIDPKFYKSYNIDVHFLEDCSKVDIGFPLQDWVVTPGGGNSLFITLNNYDINDPDLELVRVQYRRTRGDGSWINIAEIPKADLGPVFEIVEWTIFDLNDGLYEIRAVAQCVGGLESGISKVVKGQIERNAPVLFGVPQPADGFYSPGDEISITFNEPIRCELLVPADMFDNNNIGLYNTETDELIDMVFSCSGDKIQIVPNVPGKYFENKVLRVEVDNIKDLVNNNFVHKEWEFTFDQNGLNWLDKEMVYVSKYEEQIKRLERRIENRAGFANAYKIEGIPHWAKIYPSEGILLPGQVQVITFEFDSTMVFGAYADTVRLRGADGIEPMAVHARVVCHDPNWQVNAGDWDYSHNFVVQLDIEGEVSTDIEDFVAAFVGTELRGVAKLKPVALPGPLTKYEAFLTVYSNNFSGENIAFQIWDASACLLYGDILESFDFEADALNGSPQTPVILHTDNKVLRMIELNPGWNWISFNLAFADNSLPSVLGSINDSQGDLIKSQTQFSQNTVGLGWLGSLTSIHNPPMYQYRTVDADTIHQLGTLIDPTTVNIPIAAGWNWIGYLPQFPLTVNEALESLDPLNGDLIKSQTEFATFLAGFGWIGNLQYMRPTEGYLLKMAEPNTLTYPDVPVGGKPSEDLEGLKNGAKPRNSAWTVNPAQFEHSQTLIAMLENDGQNVTQSNFELGAFVNGECRGAAKAIWIEPLQSHLFFMTMYANTNGEPLEFKLADAAGAISDLQETMFFSADAAVGTVQNPFKFSTGITGVGESEEVFEPFMDVLPNPVTDGYATIRFRSENAQTVFFKITDATGRLIQSFDYQAIRGMNAMLWDASSMTSQLLPGVYLLEMREGERLLTEKVIVR